MSSINTDNFIANSTGDTARTTDFLIEQSAGESFDEHLRQAFETNAAVKSSDRSDSDRASQAEKTDAAERKRSERRDRDREDSGSAEATADRRDDADEAISIERSESQDGPRDARDSQDDSASHTTEASATDNAENPSDAEQTPGNGEMAAETDETGQPINGAELVEQLIAENAQQNQQAQLVTQHFADQRLSDANIEQASETLENLPEVEAALRAIAGSAGAPQSQNNLSAETAKRFDTAIETQTQIAEANSQDSLQSPEAGLADAATGQSAQANMETVMEETASQTDTAASTVNEQLAENTPAQVQAAVEAQQQKERRAADRLEANTAQPAEKATEGEAQTLVAPANAAASVDSNQFKSAQNTVDTVAAVDSSDKESGETKATANQPGQNDVSLAGRTQGTQDARVTATGASADGEEIDTVDRVRFVQRVARTVEGAGRDGRTLRMRLHPSELGSLRLEVTIRDGVMNARLETETQTARNILLDSLPALRDRLAQQDIKVQQFDIDYAGSNNQGSAQSESDQHQARDRSADRPGASPSGDEAETTNDQTNAEPLPRRLGGAAQLDFVA